MSAYTLTETWQFGMYYENEWVVRANGISNFESVAHAHI